MASRKTDTRWHWESLDRIDINEAHLFLFTTKSEAIVVPKQALGGAGIAAEFITTARGY